MSVLSRSAKNPLDPRRQRGFGTIAMLCVASLYFPILLLILFSFNGLNSLSDFSGFSLEWYKRAFYNPYVRTAAILSIKLALIATAIATLVATMAAIGLLRGNRHLKGGGLVYAIINQPLVLPEIITAIATLSAFALLKRAGLELGSGYLIIAHTVFCIPFAFMPIRARLEALNPIYEQAAADLYATPLQAFRKVTFPLLWPGIVSGLALSFIVSFDNVVITLMVAGPGESTLPLYIWGSVRRGLSPELNAISSILLFISIFCVVAFSILARRQKAMPDK